MRVLSLFSGIGAFEVALDELGIEWELDHYCEIDKYASQSYNCIHGTTDEYNLKDVTNIDYSKIGEVDLVTYGFPCQDISLVGNQKGFFDEEGNLTRSGLFFNAADVIRHTNPKFAIFENVKNLTGKKFKAEFETVISVLDELGYNTYWKVLNAKDYGIPQNRERVFGISIRKDIDHGYEFPLPVELTLRLKDMLENEVDETYYLKDSKDFFIKNSFDMEEKGNGFRFEPHVRKNANISKTITTRAGARMDDNFIVENIDTDKEKFKFDSTNEELKSVRLGGLFDDEKGKHQAGSIWDNGTAGNMMVYKDFRIRKLTPRECWRLMDFKDKYFDRVKGVSNTQLYKQAGNSIVVSVIEAIFESLAVQYPSDFVQRWGDDL